MNLDKNIERQRLNLDDDVYIKFAMFEVRHLILLPYASFTDRN